VPEPRRIDRYAGWLVAISIRHPKRVLGLWGVVALVASSFILQLEIETSGDSVLHRASPEWDFYQRSLDLFGGDEVIVVALAGESSFDPHALSRIASLSERLERLPGARRVDSLQSLPLIRATSDGDLDLSPGLPSDFAGTVDEALAVESRVRGDRIAHRSLVSADGSVLAVNVYLEPEAVSAPDQTVAAVRNLVDEQSGWISGVPVFRAEANGRTQSEVIVFVPLTLLLIGAFLFAVTGSWRAPVISLGVSGLGALVMLGGMGAASQALNFGTMILPSIQLALGSAYVMHILTAARGIAEPRRLEEALVAVSWPIALSGITTAIGFLAISSVRIDIVQAMGVFGSLGVLAVLAATLTAAPAALRLLPLGAGTPRLDLWIRGELRDRLLAFIVRRRTAIIVAWFLLLGVFGAGWGRLNVETDAIVWFPKGTEVRDSYESIRSHLAGISPVNVVIDSSGGEPVTRPDVVAAIDGLSEHLGGLETVGKSLSVADPLRQIHSGFSGNDDAGLPGEYSLIEQYLLLLESVEHLEDVVTDDRSSANVLLRVDNNGSVHLLEVARAAEAWWRRHGPEGFTAQATGIMYEFARAEDEVAAGQLRGLGLAFLAVGAILLLVLRSPAIAALASLPNLIPIFIAFGFMGWMDIPLDALTVVLGSLALGIAVDDTVHVVMNFSEQRREGATATEALQTTFQRVLPAVIFTTLAIGIGFGVLAVSGFTPVRNLGALTAGLVVLCLLADLTLLPALLLRRAWDKQLTPR
jgi:predicted RND superfamily exporter protein